MLGLLGRAGCSLELEPRDLERESGSDSLFPRVNWLKVGGNRDLGRRDIPTGEEQREKEGEILCFLPARLHRCLPLTELTQESESKGAWEM